MRSRFALAALAAFFSCGLATAATQSDTSIEWGSDGRAKAVKRLPTWTDFKNGKDYVEVWRDGSVSVEHPRLPGGKLPVPVRETGAIPWDKLKKAAGRAVKKGPPTPVTLAAIAAQEAWELCQEGKWLCKPGNAYPGGDHVLDGVNWWIWACYDLPPNQRAIGRQWGEVRWVEQAPLAELINHPDRDGSQSARCPNLIGQPGDIWAHVSKPLGSVPPGSAEPVAITDAEFEQSFGELVESNGLNRPVWDEIVGEVSLEDYASLQAQGNAASAPVTTTTTTTRPDGSTGTTTSTTIYNITYNNGQTSITNNTTTTRPDGSTDSTDSEVPPEGSVDFSDSALPSVPDFYAQKYPEGLASVWNKHEAAWQQASIVNWMRGVNAGLPQSGKCPEFRLPMSNFAHWLPGIGDADVSPPCWVWDVVRAFLLLTTLFVCRRVIFGG